MACGDCALRLTLPSYESVEEELTLHCRQANVKEFTLTHTKDFIESQKVLQQHRQLARRIMFGSLALGCSGIGAYFNQQAGNAYADYSRLNQSSNYNTEWEKVQNNRIARNFFYSMAGIFAAGFVISILF